MPTIQTAPTPPSINKGDSLNFPRAGKSISYSKVPSHIKVLHTSKRNRSFVVFDKDLPFYRSSGHHSGQAGTWFPCLGTQTANNPFYLFSRSKTHHKDGWIVKAGMIGKTIGYKPDTQIYEDDVVLASFYTPRVNGKGRFKDLKSFYRRMSKQKAMAISAYLGGGIWETEFGKVLKEKLAMDFPHILGRTAPIVEFIEEDDLKDTCPSMTTDEIINEFICYELQDSHEKKETKALGFSHVYSA